MITTIRISGRSDVIMPPLSPPNSELWAYAGVISIAPPGPLKATTGHRPGPILRGKSARTIAATGLIATLRATFRHACGGSGGPLEHGPQGGGRFSEKIMLH